MYLHPAEGGPELDSPLTTDYIRYYESGVWLDHADGEAFLPYGEIRTVVDGVNARRRGDATTGGRYSYTRPPSRFSSM